ncbi:unnamed protein product, partial [Rotaria sp. Silwood2]
KIIFFKDQLYQKKSTKSFKSKQIKQKSKKVKEQKTECSEATNTLENVLTNVLDQHIESFLNNQDLQELQFEDDLSPFDRRYVHQFAEKHNLQHINEDLGHQRHIIIRKNIPIEMKMITNEEKEEEENINEKFQHPKTVKKKANKLLSMDSNAPIDDLLEADHQQDNICNAQKCKIKIILLG